MSTIIGNRYEEIALNFLLKKKLSLIIKNFKTKIGEIDIILTDKEFLVFVEVRFREDNDYASGLESITYQKQRKIIKTAQMFLVHNKEYQNFYCRFDVISISRYDNKIQIHWIKNAFSN